LEFPGFGSLGVFRVIIETGNVVSYRSYWSFNERHTAARTFLGCWDRNAVVSTAADKYRDF